MRFPSPKVCAEYRRVCPIPGRVFVGSASHHVGYRRGGAAGPANPYGDPAGHVWLAIAGPREATKHVLTGSNDRTENMVAFTAAALSLFLEKLSA
jgi:nicotinamide mononucleotide (NMN) deamidase PncC